MLNDARESTSKNNRTSQARAVGESSLPPPPRPTTPPPLYLPMMTCPPRLSRFPKSISLITLAKSSMSATWSRGRSACSRNRPLMHASSSTPPHTLCTQYCCTSHSFRKSIDSCDSVISLADFVLFRCLGPTELHAGSVTIRLENGHKVK